MCSTFQKCGPLTEYLYGHGQPILKLKMTDNCQWSVGERAASCQGVLLELAPGISLLLHAIAVI